MTSSNLRRWFGAILMTTGVVTSAFTQQKPAFKLVVSDAFAEIYEKRGYFLQVNQVRVDTNTQRYVLSTHFPSFDTLFFRMNPSLPMDTILTRFRPGKEYTVFGGCCDANFEIIDAEKKVLMEYMHPPGNDFDSLRMELFASGRVRFRLVHAKAKDTLLGFYLNFAGFQSAQVLRKGKQTAFVHADMGYYGNNTAWILIARPMGGIPAGKMWEGNTVHWDDPELAGLIRLRMVPILLYDDARVLATYDVRQGKLTLELLD
jgi:hypothetical protein